MGSQEEERHARRVERDVVDVGRVFREYQDARERLDGLVNEAGALGARFQRLADALSTHPSRTIIGVPDRSGEPGPGWDVVPGDPLPRIEHLVTLTDGIREVLRKVDELRERLILMGRGDLVEEPGEFFH